jgi:hypothetical protein
MKSEAAVRLVGNGSARWVPMAGAPWNATWPHNHERSDRLAI